MRSRVGVLIARAYRTSTRHPGSEAAVEIEPGVRVPRFVVEWAESEQRDARYVLDRFAIPAAHFAGKTALVVGRGAADLAVEVAARGARRVVARDMVEVRLWLTKRALAAQEEALRVDLARFEGALADVPEDRFDLVIARDALRSYGADRASRHVEERVSDMASRLAPGGLLAVDFGPPWKAPNGGQLESRIPWAHLLFPEDVVFEEFRRARIASDARAYEDIGVNRITVGRFRQAMEATGLECVSFNTNPSRHRLSTVLRVLSQLGPLEEYLTFRICGVWRRP